MGDYSKYTTLKDYYEGKEATFYDTIEEFMENSIKRVAKYQVEEEI